MTPSNFFKDKKGNTVIIQKPNFLVIVALLFYLLSLISNNTIGFVGLWGFRITILVWSIDELSRGDSPFRRLLGFLVGSTMLLLILSDILQS